MRNAAMLALVFSAFLGSPAFGQMQQQLAQASSYAVSNEVTVKHEMMCLANRRGTKEQKAIFRKNFAEAEARCREKQDCQPKPDRCE